MSEQVLHLADCRVTDWSGGRTTELAIAPVGALYANRDFLWRFSTATAEAEQSTYTNLPDYNRVILSLSGVLRLSHGPADGGVWREFAPFEPCSFDGGADTQAMGRVVDLNLMLRTGWCEGVMIPVLGEAGHVMDATAAVDAALSGADELLIYCFEGALEAVGEEKHSLEAGDTLWASRPLGRRSLRLTQRTKAALAAVRYRTVNLRRTGHETAY